MMTDNKNEPRWLVESTVSDSELSAALDEVIARIPPEDHEAFPDVEIYEVVYTVEGANVREESLGLMQIGLSPSQLKEKVRRNRAALRGLLAHELAHALLRHPALLDEGVDGMPPEDEADEKAREWVGADVDAFRAMCGPATEPALGVTE